MCRALSKYVTHYGPWSGFLYMTTLIERASPTHHLGTGDMLSCGFEPWEPSPVPRSVVVNYTVLVSYL